MKDIGEHRHLYFVNLKPKLFAYDLFRLPDIDSSTTEISD